jgi:colanic acid/amylovoran biosynthesis glycosyltransferase
MPDLPEPFRVGYVLERYPNASETFVANEMRAVAACGAEVTAFALERGEGGRDAGVQTIYAEDSPAARPDGKTALALRAMRRAGTFPLDAPYSFLSAMRRDRVLNFFALRARELGIRHLHAHFAGLPTLVAILVAREIEGATVSFAAHARDLYVRPRAIARKARLSRLCIVCTGTGADRLRRLMGSRDRGKVMVIHHGTDMARFSFRPRPDPTSPSRILAVGRMVPKKGFAVLLRAVAWLRERREVRCTVVGDGPLRADLERQARRLGIGELVSFPGWVAYEVMPSAYHAADVLAVPSVRARDGDVDGLPNVVVEALACGTPVVASDIGGLPEAIRPDKTGLLCAPGDADGLADALDRALRSGALRARFAAAGRQLAEQLFDIHTNAHAVYEALRRAAAQRTA